MIRCDGAGGLQAEAFAVIEARTTSQNHLPAEPHPLTVVHDPGLVAGSSVSILEPSSYHHHFHIGN
jgi:hypothetical protein